MTYDQVNVLLYIIYMFPVLAPPYRHSSVASGHSRLPGVAAPARHATSHEGEGGGVSKEKENSLSLTLPYFIVFNPTMYFTLNSLGIGGGDFLCFSITTKHKGQKMLVYLQKK